MDGKSCFCWDGLMNEHLTAAESKAIVWICPLKTAYTRVPPCRQLPQGCQHPQQPIVRRAMIEW